MAKYFAFLIATLLFLFRSLGAQPVTGSMEGRVLDRDGRPVTGIRVSLTGPSLQGIRETASDKRGYFRFFSLPSGTYDVRFRHEAFHEFVQENVRVPLGGTAFLGEIRLKPIYMESYDIVVYGKPPLIDPTSTTTGANLVADTIQKLPLARDYRSVMAILPGANPSSYGDDVNVSGATGSENLYAIDGIDVTDPYMRFHNTALPYNFIKEIEVKNGGYQAEYRSSMGGLVNAVTYSGGNEFSGQMFGFFTNNDFSRSALRTELEPSRGAYSQYDIGLSLGGPIVRDRLWFFAAYNSINKNENVMIPGLREYEDRQLGSVLAGKLTWRPSSRADIVLTVIGDPSQHTVVGSSLINVTAASVLNPDPMLSRVSQGGFNFIASGNVVAGRKLFLEASLAHTIRRNRTEPATARGEEELFFIDYYSGGVVSGGNYGKASGDTRQTTASLKGTLVLGGHLFKAGIEYRDNQLEFLYDQSALQRLTADEYVLSPFVGRGIVHNRIPSLFVQDSWRIGDRLQLNLGLRWSEELLVGSDGRVDQRISGEFQPRVGFVLRPGRAGASKISGSFGRFYGELPTYLLTWYLSEGTVFHWISYDHDPRLDPTGGSDYPTSGKIQANIPGLQGHHYDEFTLGYEHNWGGGLKISATGIYRSLRNAIEDGYNPRDGMFYYGNPGRPPLEDTARMKRDYLALQLAFQKSAGKYLDFMASYTLSRCHGNYPGLFAQDMGDNRPNITGYFDSPEQVQLASGLLPNDRPHVLKVFGSCRFPFGLAIGTFFSWQSGTPLSELGTQTQIAGWWKFIAPRGTAGRTPALADLNFRVSYQMKNLMRKKIVPRIILDLFHVGSRRTPVAYEERHYLGVDKSGAQTDPNPLYMHPTAYFPPMSARLGMEIKL